MKILIVAATSREVKRIVDKLTFMHRIEQNYNNYRYGKLNIDILITGYGSIFMAYYLTKAISIISYDLAINVGMSGSYDYFLEQGFVLNIIQDEFADLGVENANQFYTLPEMELMDENQFPFEQGKLRAFDSFDIMEVETLIPVKSVTVNTMHGHQESIDLIRKKFNPDIETTEGAAFYFVCMKERIKCLQIRCVSHYVDISKVENWNIPLTLKNLRNSMMNILDELNMAVSSEE